MEVCIEGDCECEADGHANVCFELSLPSRAGLYERLDAIHSLAGLGLDAQINLVKRRIYLLVGHDVELVQGLLQLLRLAVRKACTVWV